MSYARRFDRERPTQQEPVQDTQAKKRLFAWVPVLCIAALQGTLLWILDPAQSTAQGLLFVVRAVLLLFGVSQTLVLLVSTFFFLSPERNRRMLIVLSCMSVLMAYLGWFDGWMRGDLPSFQGVTQGAHSLVIFVAWFCLFPYLQRWIMGGRYEWYDIFRFVTLNLFSIGFAGFVVFLLSRMFFYTGTFLSFLGLRLFDGAFFVSVFLSIVYAFALILMQRARKLQELVYNYFWGVFCWGFPGLSFAGIIFLVSLPLAGVTFFTGKHSLLFFVLALQASTIFLCFSTWRGGTSNLAFPPTVEGFVRFYIATLPLYSCLGLYALWLRVAQYGWSVNRVFGAVALFVLLLWACAYFFVLVSQKKRWVQLNGEVNRVLLCVTGIILFISVTPVFDVYRIAAASQKSRFLSETTQEGHFDYNYMRFALGARGRDALKAIELASTRHELRGVRLRIQETLAKKRPGDTPSLQVRKQLIAASDIFPYGKHLDQWDREAILALFRAGERVPPSFILVDLNDDGEDEAIAAFLDGHYWVIFERISGARGAWRRVGTLHRAGKANGGQNTSPAEVLRSAEKGDIWTLPRTFFDLQIGNSLYRVTE